jgi:hypothetical protein
MRELTWSGGATGRRTLTLGEADGLSKSYTFAPGEAVEVTNADADAILRGDRAEGFVEGGAKRPAETPEPDADPVIAGPPDEEE